MIDDFFAISVEPAHEAAEQSRSFLLHGKAQEAYESQKILGSPSKDVLASDYAKVIGATVDSRPSTRRRGLVKIGAPPEKRYGLSWITLNLLQLRQTSDSLHLSLIGGWVSALTYRQPMLGILNKAFSLVKEEDYDPPNPRILPLDRKTREELLLLAILQPMMVTNVGAKVPDEIFASDASLEKGAIVSTKVSPQIFAALFKTARNKGGYTKLMAASERFLEEECPSPIVDPSRPIVTRFGFIEVFAGAALVTEEMKKLGHLVLTPIELSNSEEFNAEFCHVAAWLTHVIANHRVEGYMMEPPCTTFSIMRRPQLRSKEEPLGFNVQDPQTATGTALVSTGGRYYVPGLLETPFSSKMRHLPSWRRLERRPGISQTRTDSCRFGSPHLKPFRFLGSHINLEGISKRCRCKEEGRVHIRSKAPTPKPVPLTPRLLRRASPKFSI